MTAPIPVSRPTRLATGIPVGMLSLAAVGFGLTRIGLVDPGTAGARLLSILYGYWVAAVFALLQVGIGAAALRHLGTRGQTASLSAATRAVLAFGVGSYVTYTLLLALAIANQLNLVTVGIYGALSFVASMYALWSARRRPKLRGNEAEDEATREDENERPRTHWLWLTVLALWCVPFVLQTALPNTDWDGALFHLPFAKQIIEVGVLGTDPVFDANNYPAAMHLIYAVFLLVGAKTAILPFGFLVACGILLVLYCLGREFWDARLGRLAVLVGLTVNILWEVAVTPRIDSFLAFYFVVAVLAFLLWRRGKWGGAPNVAKKVLDPFPLVLGMMLGMTLGIKFTAIYFVVVLVPLAVAAAVRDKLKRGKPLVAPILLAATFAAVPSAFWYARNAVQLDDPIYPFLNKSHVYRESDGTLHKLRPAMTKLTAREPSEQQIHNNLSGSPFEFVVSEDPPERPATPANLFNLVDALRRSSAYARKPLHTTGPFILLFFLVPFVARDRWSWLIFAIGLSLYLLIARQTFLVRYLAPVLPLLAFGAAFFAFRWGRRVDKGMNPFSGMLAVLAVVFLVPISVYEWQKLAKLEPVSYWSGNESEEEFIARVGYNENRIFARLVPVLNEAVRNGSFGPDFKLIMIAEGCGDLLLCDYTGDMTWHALPWQVQMARADGDVDQVARNLRAEGYDHILVNHRRLHLCHDLRSNDLQRQRLRWTLYHLNRFLQTRTETMVDEYGILLAKIKYSESARTACQGSGSDARATDELQRGPASTAALSPTKP